MIKTQWYTWVVGDLKNVSYIDLERFQIMRRVYLHLLRCLVVPNEDKAFEGHFGRQYWQRNGMEELLDMILYEYLSSFNKCS